jgi:hypothetical protein
MSSGKSNILGYQVIINGRVINDSMGKVLMSLMMPYMKTRSINTLRKEGALNITLKPEDLAKPTMDQARIELALASKVRYHP